MSNFVDVKVAFRETLEDPKPFYDIWNEKHAPKEVVLSLPTSGIIFWIRARHDWLKQNHSVLWDLGEEGTEYENKPMVKFFTHALLRNGKTKLITPENFKELAKAYQDKKIDTVIVVWGSMNTEKGQIRYQPFMDRIIRIQLALQRITWAKAPARSKLIKKPTDFEDSTKPYTMAKMKYYQRYLHLTYQRDWNRGKNLLASPEMQWVSQTAFGIEKALEQVNPRLAKGGWPTKEQLTTIVGQCWRIR